jgi:hypothetical protein
MAERSIFNVDQFKAAMVGGGARANQFFVALSFPSYVTQGGAAAAQAAFLVNATTLPGSIVQPTLVPYRGREVKFAGERIFNPWQIQVMNDTTFNIRNSFERWMAGINGLQNNSGRTNPRDYQANITVTQLDRNNNPLKVYTLASAFPTEISDINLSYADNDTIETYTVTFQYQHYTTALDTALSLGNLVNNTVNIGNTLFGTR